MKDDTAFANFNACARPVELEIAKAAELFYAVLREDPELRQNLEVQCQYTIADDIPEQLKLNEVLGEDGA